MRLVIAASVAAALVAARVASIAAGPQGQAAAAQTAIAGSATSITIHYTEDGESWASVAGPSGGGLQIASLGVIVRAT